MRAAKNMSRADLAERIGVSVGTVKRWELEKNDDLTNSIRPRKPTKLLLGIIFGVDPATITYGDAEEAKE